MEDLNKIIRYKYVQYGMKIIQGKTKYMVNTKIKANLNLRLENEEIE